MMWRVLMFFATALATSANPVSGYLVNPPHTMVAENVVVGVTEKGAIVTGTYRFRVTPDAAEYWRKPPYRLAFQLPVPVPRSLKKFEDVEIAVHPFITIRGARYFPAREILNYGNFTLPSEVRLAVFSFEALRPDLEEEFDITIQYEQPVLTIQGKELVYYVPFLPTYDRYQEKLGLSRESYLIAFEGYGGVRLRLAQEVEVVKKSTPEKIVVQPRHKEVIAVERIIAPAR